MNNYRNSNDGWKSLGMLAIIVMVTCFFLYKFLVAVVRQNKLLEFFISTPILFLALYGSYKFTEYNSSLSLPQYLLCYVVPLFIYAFYWIIVLNSSKTVSYNKRANLNWSSKDWWWSLDGWEFEEEVARVFELNGYKTKVTKKSGDGGIDIIMYKNNYKYAVQCKHYQDEVPVEPIRALNGVKDDFGADILIIVASSGITKAGHDFIANKPYIKLMTLNDIIEMGLHPVNDEAQEESQKEINPVADFVNTDYFGNFDVLKVVKRIYKAI